MINMNIQFGDRLKQLRIESRLTQEELGKIFGTGKASISHYEKNVRLAGPKQISKYAEYFGVSLDYIMGKSNIRNAHINQNVNIEGATELIGVTPKEKDLIEKLRTLGVQNFSLITEALSKGNITESILIQLLEVAEKISSQQKK